MAKTHDYRATVTWTGGWREGARRDYRGYSREHLIEIEGKEAIRGSSDPAFLGDPALHNPEDMLVASLSACHMLWYLHLSTVKEIHVLDYRDEAFGEMMEEPGGAGRFSRVVLRPRVMIGVDGDAGLAASLHGRAHKMCFIANSVNFPVSCEPVIETGG